MRLANAGRVPVLLNKPVTLKTDQMRAHGSVRGGPLWGNGGFSVILADEFADIFDGFSIGSNDLTQLRLVWIATAKSSRPIFDERNAALKKMIAQIIFTCRAKGRTIRIYGQIPSDYPEFTQFLVAQHHLLTQGKTL